jgi:hypothetical protein
MHHFIIGILSLVSTLAHYFVLGDKRNLAPIRLLISYLQNEENSKMEDHLHAHRTRVKQWSNDSQIDFVWCTRTYTPNRTIVGFLAFSRSKYLRDYMSPIFFFFAIFIKIWQLTLCNIKKKSEMEVAAPSPVGLKWNNDCTVTYSGFAVQQAPKIWQTRGRWSDLTLAVRAHLPLTYWMIILLNIPKDKGI